MAPIPNAQVTYVQVPSGTYPVPGKDLVYDADKFSIDLDTVSLNGGVLLKTLDLSLDPYLRGRMRDPSIKSYSEAAQAGEPLAGFGSSEVLRSETSKYKQGDLVTGVISWRAYNVVPGSHPLTIIKDTHGLPTSAFVGVCGMPGQTAFYSLKAFSDMKAGEKIFVSTAAGAVGSVVCQLAKIAGLTVVGSAGDDEKVQFLKDKLQIDHAFNYKDVDLREELKKHGPFDLYYDNVSGETLDAALANMADFGRVICCGVISTYEKSWDLKEYKNILMKSLSVHGFIVGNLVDRFGPDIFYDEYVPLVKQGKIVYREHKDVGLEHTAEALVNMLKGKNQGKAVVQVASK